MKIKEILIFTVLVFGASFVVDYIHDNFHNHYHHNEDCKGMHNHSEYHGKTDTGIGSDDYGFELGDEVDQPWGAEIFCEENPEKCGMN